MRKNSNEYSRAVIGAYTDRQPNWALLRILLYLNEQIHIGSLNTQTQVGVDGLVGSMPTCSTVALQASRVRVPVCGPFPIPPPLSCSLLLLTVNKDLFTIEIKKRFTNSLRQHKPSFGVKTVLSGFTKTSSEELALKRCGNSYFCAWPYWICICRSFPFRHKIYGGEY